MTNLYLNPLHLNKWMHQNGAVYTGNFFPGVLLDNFILDCKRGYAFVYEHYLNPNSSDYLITFFPYKKIKKESVSYDRLWCEFLIKEEEYIQEIDG